MTLDELRGRLFLDVPTAAREVFGLDERTVRRGIKDGQIPAVKIGVRTLIPVPALLAMLGAKGNGEDHTGSEDSSGAGHEPDGAGLPIPRQHLRGVSGGAT